jgi:transposase-like protein
MSSGFKGRHYPAEFILLCVRWYLKFNVSYRHLAEMMQERGFVVHHTTMYRWIQTYSPQLEKLIRWYQGYTTSSWRVDETYINVAANGSICSELLIAVGAPSTSIYRSAGMPGLHGAFSPKLSGNGEIGLPQ